MRLHFLNSGQASIIVLWEVDKKSSFGAIGKVARVLAPGFSPADAVRQTHAVSTLE